MTSHTWLAKQRTQGHSDIQFHMYTFISFFLKIHALIFQRHKCQEACGQLRGSDTHHTAVCITTGLLLGTWEMKSVTLLSLTTHLDHPGTVSSWPSLCTLQSRKDASPTKGLTHVITFGKFLLRDSAPPDTFQAESCKHSIKRKHYTTNQCLCNREDSWKANLFLIPKQKEGRAPSISSL